MTNSRASLVEALLGDRTRGAAELARWSVRGLAEFVERASLDSVRLHDAVVELGRTLAEARPSMVAIRNLVERWIEGLPDPAAVGIEGYREAAVRLAERLAADSLRDTRRAAAHAARVIGSDKTVMTHSRSSTVLACLEILAPDVRAIVTESRPPGEGRTLAAQLSGLSIQVDFISDQQMAVFVSRADAVLVGADTVARDGSVVNKAGTRLLALAARDAAVPFYVCYESIKQSARAASELTLEAHDPGEIGLADLPHVTVHNIYFDVTPPSLVTGWITEGGVREGEGPSREGAPAR